MSDNKKSRIDNDTLLRLALIAGIVTLASLGVDGWGWLIFILVFTL